MQEEEEKRDQEEIEDVDEYVNTLDPSELELSGEELREHITDGISHHIKGIPTECKISHTRVLLKDAAKVHFGIASGLIHVVENLPTVKEVH